MKACTTHLQPIKAVDPEALPATTALAENGTETPNGSVPPETKPEDAKLAGETSRAPTPVPVPTNGYDDVDDYDIAEEASRIPLDSAIAASIATLGSENKAKAAASAILLIGGSTALKGLNAFLAERYVHVRLCVCGRI
jgi:actin-related protein 8